MEVRQHGIDERIVDSPIYICHRRRDAIAHDAKHQVWRGEWRRGRLVVIHAVSFQSRGDGAQVILHAADLGTHLRLEEVWDRDGGQDRYDGDNNQQLDQRERPTDGWRHCRCFRSVELGVPPKWIEPPLRFGASPLLVEQHALKSKLSFFQPTKKIMDAGPFERSYWA